MLDIWTPDLTLSPAMLKKIEGHRRGKDLDWTDTKVLSWKFVGDLEVVWCPGYCYWHNDKEIGKYSALLVVCNETESRVQVAGITNDTPQPVGTMILFDIRKRHRLAQSNQLPRRKGLWGALVVNYPTAKPTRNRCEIDIFTSLEQKRN